MGSAPRNWRGHGPGYEDPVVFAAPAASPLEFVEQAKFDTCSWRVAAAD